MKVIYTIGLFFILFSIQLNADFFLGFEFLRPGYTKASRIVSEQVDAIKKTPEPLLGYHALMGGLFAATIWTRPGRAFLKNISVNRPIGGYDSISQAIKHDVKSLTSFILHGGKPYVVYHSLLGIPALHYSAKKRGYSFMYMSYPQYNPSRSFSYCNLFS